MDALDCQHLSRKLKAREHILPFQIRKLGQDTLYRIASGQIFENAFDRVPQTTNTGLPMANRRINGNTCKQLIVQHVAIVPIRGENAKTIS